MARRRFLILVIVLASMVLALTACGAGEDRPTEPTPTPNPELLRELAIEPVFPSLTFTSPTNMVQPDDGQHRFYITEQGGRVLWSQARPEATSANVFLDISDLVSTGNNEEGLLGIAFPPDYAESGDFYLFYSAAAPRRSVLSHFARSQEDSARADPASEDILLEVPQPFGNHNGGQLAFGPDGYLYLGLGDSGGRGDPFGNGQNPRTLLGTILRIDVSQTGEDSAYAVPPDNPFADGARGRPEVWAYGFRNPWRFSFDRDTGDLWVGDVGQNDWEEVDIVQKGGNYGWNIMEGEHCYPAGRACEPPGDLLPPVHEYTNTGALTGDCSITGGYVYRGTAIPWLRGAYVYGDYCSGKVWGLRHHEGQTAEGALFADTDLNITSFAEGLDGELYVLSRDHGIYLLVEA